MTAPPLAATATCGDAESPSAALSAVGVDQVPRCGRRATSIKPPLKVERDQTATASPLVSTATCGSCETPSVALSEVGPSHVAHRGRAAASTTLPVSVKSSQTATADLAPSPTCGAPEELLAALSDVGVDQVPPADRHAVSTMKAPADRSQTATAWPLALTDTCGPYDWPLAALTATGLDHIPPRGRDAASITLSVPVKRFQTANASPLASTPICGLPDVGVGSAECRGRRPRPSPRPRRGLHHLARAAGGA